MTPPALPSALHQALPSALPDGFEAALLERFLRYVSLGTASDEEAASRGKLPSTQGQMDFARVLAAELPRAGAEEVHVTDHGYVCARVSPSPGREAAPAICFLAHLDTSSAAPGEGVVPCVRKNYDGKPIVLNHGIVLDPASDSDLGAALGQTIIHSDGATLLGADDKGGIAEIITALEILRADSRAHGPIEVIFSPDEETGHGMDKVPLDWLRAQAAYTLDGGGPPILEAECFNAYKSEVVFTGVARHTGTARPGMVNAVTMAAQFIALLPRQEAPETTDGRQGFIFPMAVTGTMERAQVSLLLRDFDSQEIEERQKTVEILARAACRAFRGGAVEITHTRQYGNMKEGMEKEPRALALLSKAAKNLGLEPVFRPIRGGTDGSRLTEMGLPCPNIFTGGHNFHSRSEWASLEQMALGVGMILELASLWGGQ